MQPDRCFVHVNSYNQWTTWTLRVQEIRPAPRRQGLITKRKSNHEQTQTGVVFESPFCCKMISRGQNEVRYMDPAFGPDVYRCNENRASYLTFMAVVLMFFAENLFAAFHRWQCISSVQRPESNIPSAAPTTKPLQLVFSFCFQSHKWRQAQR